MTKKFPKRVSEPLSPKPAVKQEDTAYLVREDLDEQQERLMNAAAAGANALTTPAPAAAAEQPPPAAAASKPLAPLAALWPSSVPPRGDVTPSQGPAPAPAAPLPQPPVQSTPPKSLEKAAVAVAAAKLTAPQSVKVNFVLLEPGAKQVALCGDFNGWSPTATPMKRHDDGHWGTTVALAPGRYQYKFVVDGEWIADPAAQKNVPNEHGSLNSVIEVVA
jgi:Glycogen recognition site of AMP-activated protein kinase